MSHKNLKGIILVVVILSIFIWLFVYVRTAAALTFDRDLKIGDSGEDVRELQKILNRSNATLVANTGPGSPGNETAYFGLLTKYAVISFQELYREEILTPNALARGTGYVGRATRSKLNTLGTVSTAPSISTTNTSPLPAIRAGSPSASIAQSSATASQTSGVQRIFSTSKYQMKPGEIIEVVGTGFSSGKNILHLGIDREIVLAALPGRSDTYVSVLPPDIAYGKYEIWFTTDKGETSRSAATAVFVLITNAPVSSPAISLITPIVATLDQEIQISGSLWSKSGNNIYSSLGNVSNITSDDGKMIRVKIRAFPQAATLERYLGGKGVEVEAWLFVQNENGVTPTAGTFRIKL